MAAAAVAAAVDSDRNDSDDERKESREDVKVDDHNALAEESHEHVEKELTAHVEKEVTIVSHDGDDHQEGIREENVSTVVKAAVVEAKAEEVVKKVEVEKKLEEKNEVSRMLDLTTKNFHLPFLYTVPANPNVLPIKCTQAA